MTRSTLAPLAAGRALEPGTEIFAGAHDAVGLGEALGRHPASSSPEGAPAGVAA
ncbi:hypothetical protein [Sinomonas susongensis]|uniref:hypothetical protein n=1 Tax=Sinomonas susongensis TaxID=1324851 RepID=UPI001FE2EC9F|nr:hypothetical protein [Sinomonas susongensis]